MKITIKFLTQRAEEAFEINWQYCSKHLNSSAVACNVTKACIEESNRSVVVSDYIDYMLKLVYNSGVAEAILFGYNIVKLMDISFLFKCAHTNSWILK